MKDEGFLKKFIDADGCINNDILDIDHELTGLCWLPIPNTRIVPDDWNLFKKLWQEHRSVSHPENYQEVAWDTLCIWKAPDISEEIINHEIYPQKIVDWSPFFPAMFQKINSVMPYQKIWMMTLASNKTRIPIHADCTLSPKFEVFHPWPNSVRVILEDENEKPTFYIAPWPNELLKQGKIQQPNRVREWSSLKEPDLLDKCYVQLPSGTNTFVYSNGPFLHGADYHNKSKILLLVWGKPDPDPWKQKLKEFKHQFSDKLNLCRLQEPR